MKSFRKAPELLVGVCSERSAEQCVSRTYDVSVNALAFVKAAAFDAQQCLIHPSLRIIQNFSLAWIDALSSLEVSILESSFKYIAEYRNIHPGPRIPLGNIASCSAFTSPLHSS
ncbi:hypothetical protein MRX96_038703 [Rhipicephalus microplus]